MTAFKSACFSFHINIINLTKFFFLFFCFFFFFVLFCFVLFGSNLPGPLQRDRVWFLRQQETNRRARGGFLAQAARAEGEGGSEEEADQRLQLEPAERHPETAPEGAHQSPQEEGGKGNTALFRPHNLQSSLALVAPTVLLLKSCLIK